MWRILFLILILFSSIAFPRTHDTPLAVKFDEFEAATIGDIKSRIDKYYSKLADDPNSRGLILNFGTSKDISVRVKQIQQIIIFRHFNPYRLTLDKGGYSKKIVTELWIIPPGAETPQFETETVKMSEFSIVRNTKMNSSLANFVAEFFSNPKQRGYILNHGSASDISKREKYIKKYLLAHRLDLSRVMFLKDENDKIMKTELWLNLAKSIQNK